jgi:two-component system, OmpR family, sensor histidine kinase KdpD
LAPSTASSLAILLDSVLNDLRTPLAIMKGATTALLDPAVDPTNARARESVHTIADEVDRLTRLVENLADVIALESGTLRVRKEWRSLQEVVGAALGRLDERLEARTVAVRIAPDAAMAALDAGLIEQVLVNLLENALKYTPVGSPIDISARREVDGVVVEIADAGGGIPDGESEAIFDGLARDSGLRGARAPRASGAGLGLPICRGIVAAHDGRIWAANRPEGGASFRFLLPGRAPARLM